MASQIKEINKTGQPILIGTRSVDDSKTLSLFLFRENLEHSLLNARNMAGRGTDIKLSYSAKSAGGLFVIVQKKMNLQGLIGN